MSMSSATDSANVVVASDEMTDRAEAYFTPTFEGLGPGKQLQLLHAKIVELEQMQTMASSNASFDMLSEPNGDETTDLSGILVGQNYQNEKGPNGSITDLPQLMQFCEKLSKMELELTTFKQFCMSSKDENNLLTEHKALQARVAKMEQKIAELKKQQKNADEKGTFAISTTQKLFLIHPQNRWNSADCHSDLLVTIKPDCLTVYRHVPNMRFHYLVPVRAQFAVPRHHCGIFFFELKIEKMAELCAFGLAPKSVPSQEQGYWYRSDGTFWGHNVHGCNFFDKRPFVFDKDNIFAVGDVVGCGLNLSTRQIIYTRNGERLDTTGCLIHLSELYPIVALKDAGDRVRANFGPDFMYDLHKECLE